MEHEHVSGVACVGSVDEGWYGMTREVMIRYDILPMHRLVGMDVECTETSYPDDGITSYAHLGPAR